MGIFDLISARVRKRRLQSAWDKARARDWPEEVQTYLDAGPPATGPVGDAAALAVDLETDGLDPVADHIVSAGWLPITGQVLSGAGAEHIVVAAPGERSREAVAVHGLTDSDVARGVQLREMLKPFYTALAGRVLLAHFCDIELSFMRQASIQAYGAVPPLVALDTMIIEVERRRRRGIETRDSLRLLDLRSEYGLPAYENHHALGDAHACAELFLAQMRRDTLADAPLHSFTKGLY